MVGAFVASLETLIPYLLHYFVSSRYANKSVVPTVVDFCWRSNAVDSFLRCVTVSSPCSACTWRVELRVEPGLTVSRKPVVDT